MEMNQPVKLGLSLLILISAVSSAAATAHEKGKTLAHIEKEAGEDHEKTCEERLNEPLVLVKADDPDYFGGMTERGFERLKAAQASLKNVTEKLNANFEGIRGIGEMDLLTMATRENALILGPPGGAKSGHLMWMIPENDLWYKTMHELLTDAAIFGGQTRAGIEQGIEARNTMYSIARKKYGMVDELPNANAMITGSMLSFMNPGERFIQENGMKTKAETRSVFSTGNATRAQMLAHYFERGLFTGPAMLNRAIFKSWVPNWLSLDEQYRRDKIIKQVAKLTRTMNYGPHEEQKKARALLKGLETEDIDMEAIEAFAESAFYVHEDLEAAVREFANLFRVAINEKIRASDLAHREDPIKNPLVKTPSADPTERFRASLMKVVVYSAALDYLRVVTPESLDPKKFKKQIVLKPMSLWRVMYAMTTIGPGENRFNPKTGQIDFNLTKNNEPKLTNVVKTADNREITYKNYMLEGAKDQTELEEMKFMWEEQELTNNLIKKINGELQAQAKDLAPYMPTTEDALLGLDNNAQDFEIMNWRAQEALRPSAVKP